MHTNMRSMCDALEVLPVAAEIGASIVAMDLPGTAYMGMGMGVSMNMGMSISMIVWVWVWVSVWILSMDGIMLT
ncbi:hypothetical protein EON63_16170 [archaeon]|nr:MAG: hypothetical protein EON63_16170 [archaeon]